MSRPGALLRGRGLRRPRQPQVRGLRPRAQLSEGRGDAIVGIFVLAAVLTPPDVVSQLMLAIPMCLLCALGIIASRAVGPKAA